MEGIRMMGFSWVLASSYRSAWKCIKQEKVLKDHTNSYMENGLRKTLLEGRKPINRLLP